MSRLELSMLRKHLPDLNLNLPEREREKKDIISTNIITSY